MQESAKKFAERKRMNDPMRPDEVAYRRRMYFGGQRERYYVEIYGLALFRDFFLDGFVDRQEAEFVNGLNLDFNKIEYMIF